MMKKIVLFISALLLVIGTFANNENEQNEKDKLKSVLDATSEFIGESLLVINDFVFPDTLDAASKGETVAVKKGYEPLMQLAPKGKKVFLLAEDDGVLAHTKRNINYWHFWQVADAEKDADFVMEVKFRYGNLGRSYCYAVFYNANGKEVYRTNEVDNFANADFNFKRSAVNNLMDNVIKPMFEL